MECSHPPVILNDDQACYYFAFSSEWKRWNVIARSETTRQSDWDSSPLLCLCSGHGSELHFVSVCFTEFTMSITRCSQLTVELKYIDRRGFLTPHAIAGLESAAFCRLRECFRDDIVDWRCCCEESLRLGSG